MTDKQTLAQSLRRYGSDSISHAASRGIADIEAAGELMLEAARVLADPTQMTPTELADRLKRGEKWALAEQPAEQGPVGWPVGSAELHVRLLNMGKAMAKERSREIGDAWNQLADLLALLAKSRMSPPAEQANVRDAETELNCAEEVLDGYAAHLDLKETAFDCIGDYITAVCETLKVAAPQPAEQEPVWVQPNHLQQARRGAFLCRIEPQQRDDFVALYPEEPQPAKREPQ